MKARRETLAKVIPMPATRARRQPAQPEPVLATVVPGNAERFFVVYSPEHKIRAVLIPAGLSGPALELALSIKLPEAGRTSPILAKQWKLQYVAATEAQLADWEPYATAMPLPFPRATQIVIAKEVG